MTPPSGLIPRDPRRRQTMSTYRDLADFVHRHRTCGALTGDAAEPASNGYRRDGRVLVRRAVPIGGSRPRRRVRTPLCSPLLVRGSLPSDRTPLGLDASPSDDAKQMACAALDAEGAVQARPEVPPVATGQPRRLLRMCSSTLARPGERKREESIDSQAEIGDVTPPRIKKGRPG